MVNELTRVKPHGDFRRNEKFPCAKLVVRPTVLSIESTKLKINDKIENIRPNILNILKKFVHHQRRGQRELHLDIIDDIGL